MPDTALAPMQATQPDPWTLLTPWAATPWLLNPWADAADYMIDACQRTLLFLDVLRQRGNQHHRQMERTAPTVLVFDSEVVMDGADLPRPVNYALTRVLPPAGVQPDPQKRAFVIVDPRAGHGPGIGGFKADSEIGVALRAGHPCYFVSFLPIPVPGQTIEDVVRAEQAFVACVAALHPSAEGRPVVVGNCQAGWQVAMAAATDPAPFGPLILAGTPLSYWAGRHGGSAMRYSGGLLGGSWLTELTSDLGAGLFDGSWLVLNFEGMNPANTYWTKQYTLYGNIATEVQRYLGFERWWTGHVLLNGAEIQYIVDNLFIGNRLSTAEMTTTDGVRIDLRNIQSPIVVFCSWGDDITPPPQALGWILDSYETVSDIQMHGQTIVYAVHDEIGHLGIFVSAKVARKEHERFTSNIDFIDVLPPGLYEAEILPAEPGDPTPYRMRFAARTMHDIRAIVQPNAGDDRRFATVARVSQANLGLYRTVLQPFVRAAITPALAAALREWQPLRLQYTLFSDANPAMAPVASLAALAAATRRPTAPHNLFAALEHASAGLIVAMLDAAGHTRDWLAEQTMLAVYGSPLLQAAAGLRAQDGPVRRRPGLEPEERDFLAHRVAALRARIPQGGLREAFARALAYVAMAEHVADERSFEMLRGFVQAQGIALPIEECRTLLRDQFFMLKLDRHAALAAIPALLRQAPPDLVASAAAELRTILLAGAPLRAAAAARLTEVEVLMAPPRITALPEPAVQPAA